MDKKSCISKNSDDDLLNSKSSKSSLSDNDDSFDAEKYRIILDPFFNTKTESCKEIIGSDDENNCDFDDSLSTKFLNSNLSDRNNISDAEESNIKLDPLFKPKTEPTSKTRENENNSETSSTQDISKIRTFQDSDLNLLDKDDISNTGTANLKTKPSTKTTKDDKIYSETSVAEIISDFKNLKNYNICPEDRNNIFGAETPSKTEQLSSSKRILEDVKINLEPSSTQNGFKFTNFNFSGFPKKNNISDTRIIKEKKITSKPPSTKNDFKFTNFNFSDFSKKDNISNAISSSKINPSIPLFTEPRINFIGERIMFQDENIRLLQFKLAGNNPIFDAKGFKIYFTEANGVKCCWKICKNFHSYDLELYDCYDLNEYDISIKINTKYKSSKLDPIHESFFLKDILKKDLPIRKKLFDALFLQDSTFEIQFEIFTQHKSLPFIYKKFASLFNNPNYSDITFLVGDEKFYAQRVILAQESSVFKKMFENPFQQIIQIDNFEPEVFKLFLQSFYTGKISPSNKEQWLPLASLVYEYGVGFPIDSVCTKNLAVHCGVENVLEAYALFDKMKKLPYKMHVEKFILANFNKIGQEKLETFFESNPNLAAELTGKLLLRKSEVGIKLRKYTIKDLFSALTSE